MSRQPCWLLLMLLALCAAPLFATQIHPQQAASSEGDSGFTGEQVSRSTPHSEIIYYVVLIAIPIFLVVVSLIIRLRTLKGKVALLEDELQEDESRLRDIQKLAHLGNWYWDVKTGEVEWSEEVFHIFQLDPEKFIPQIDSILALSPWPEDHKRDEELIQRAIESREIGSYEQRFIRPDGSTGYYFSTFQGVYDDDGNLTAMTGTVQDITSRKRVEEEKARLEEQYYRTQRVESIGRLAGGVAHDLNNLLSPILGYGELLLDEISYDDSRREHVNEILRAGLLARDLVRQLLAFGRKQALEYRPVSMNEVVSNFERLLRRTIREDIEIRIILSSKDPTIFADVGQIRQVIMNLSVNAQDAMPDGGRLTIETAPVVLDENYAADHQDVKPGAYVMLAISDTGCGIDDETRTHIFEPFFSTKGEHGTGLGLATVYGIVKQHEGNIEIYSELGKGTSFKVYLPISKTMHVEKEMIQRDSNDDQEGSESILLVEDNEQVRRLSRTILKRLGYKVLVAENGAEALEIIASFNDSFHLLLSDVVMPEMDGKELFGKAKAMCPGLKVLYMSGYTDNVIAQRGLLEEGITFIQKPFTIRALAAKIRDVLDQE